MHRNYLLLCFFGILACLIASTVARVAIVGGHTAGTDQLPYQASLVDSRKRIICGAAIIGDRFVLTAARCVIGQDNKVKPVPMHIIAGTNDLRSASVRVVTGHIKKIYVPKVFNNPPQKALGDIAVLKLRESLELDTTHRWLRVVHLSSKHDLYTNVEATIAGFGYTWVKEHDYHNGGGNNGTLLRYAHAHVLSFEQCHSFLYDFEEFSKKHLCARVQQGPVSQSYGACLGDSGGPLVYNNMVIGVLMGGPKSCAERFIPGVYTRVSEYLDFIHDAQKDKTRNLRMHQVHW